MRGYLITFEGPDGAGKTTVINEIIKQLPQSLQERTLVTREPGGSKISENIRTIILDPENKEMDDRTEALLYAAQRSQHVSEVIRPALAAGSRSKKMVKSGSSPPVPKSLICFTSSMPKFLPTPW